MFDNGLPLGPTDWISDGVLSALIQTRYSARLTGLPVTPAIDNLIFETSSPGAAQPGRDDRQHRARPLLTCLWYIREVDPQTLLLTGLTRDGVYLVENGEVAGAVNNFRFNESPVGMLGRLAEWARASPRCRANGATTSTRHHAAAANRGVQHVLGQPGQLSPAGSASGFRPQRSGRAALRWSGPGAGHTLET